MPEFDSSPLQVNTEGGLMKTSDGTLAVSFWPISLPLAAVRLACLQVPPSTYHLPMCFIEAAYSQWYGSEILQTLTSGKCKSGVPLGGCQTPERSRDDPECHRCPDPPHPAWVVDAAEMLVLSQRPSHVNQQGQ
jgi:hypothetical protein